jgi:hypothetical protein
MDLLREIRSDQYRKLIPYFLYKRFDLSNKLEDIFYFKNDKGGSFYLKGINIIYPTPTRKTPKETERNYKNNKIYVDISQDLTYGAGTKEDPFGWYDYTTNFYNAWKDYYGDNPPDVFLKGVRVFYDETPSIYTTTIPFNYLYNNLPYVGYPSNVRYFGWEDEPPYMFVNLLENNNYFLYCLCGGISDPKNHCVMCDGILIDNTNSDFYLIPFFVNMVLCFNKMQFGIDSIFHRTLYHPLYNFLESNCGIYKSTCITVFENGWGKYLCQMICKDTIHYINLPIPPHPLPDTTIFENCIFNLSYDEIDGSHMLHNTYTNCLFEQNLDNIYLKDFNLITTPEDVPEITEELFNYLNWYNNNWNIGINKNEYDLFKNIRNVQIGTGYFGSEQNFSTNGNSQLFMTLQKSTSLYPYFEKIPLEVIYKNGDYLLDSNYNYSSNPLKTNKIDYKIEFEEQSILECKISKERLTDDTKYIDVLFRGYFVER